jgi:hypothetical protein
MNAIIVEPRLNEFQKIHLREILARKSKSICHKAGLACRAIGEPKPTDQPYAEFWCRTGRAKLVECLNGTYAEFAGILQFSIYPANPLNSLQVEQAAKQIVKSFSHQHWTTDEAKVCTDQMAWKWLSLSHPRIMVLIVDGSFDYSVWLNQSDTPTLD